jgi:hypothetical protein
MRCNSGGPARATMQWFGSDALGLGSDILALLYALPTC